MLGRADAELERCGVDVVCGYGCLDGMWMKGDAGGNLVSCVRVGIVIGGMHDVMCSRGNVWDGYGGSRELYGCVCGG